MVQWLNSLVARAGGFATYICIAVAALLSVNAVAQTSKLLQQGNQLYSEKRYGEATQNYLKALQKDPNNTTGLFNLGTALYQNKKYDSSRKVMSVSANAIKDKGGKAAANYNIGNSYMAERKWEDAIAAYKNTLRNNPQDADAKYNLSYAQQMLKQENKNGGGKNDKQNKDKKDQNKDKQQQQDKKDQDNKDKDKQQQNGDNKDKQDDKQDQQPQGQPSKLTQQQADQLLNAVQQQEKKLQDKKMKEKGVPVKMDKDW
jgi:Ca-activated chloride channel family protein